MTTFSPARLAFVPPGSREVTLVPGFTATVKLGGRPDPSVVAPIAERFGLSFDFTEVPDLVARHNLRSPALIGLPSRPTSN